MHQVENHSCKTCEGVVDPGKYCPDCGLHNIGKKSGLWNFILEGVEQIVSLEKGFIQGFKNSLINPRNIVMDYYCGYRNHSPSPGKMVLYTLLSLGVLYLVFGRIGALDVTISGEQKDDFNSLKLFMIILIPFMVLSSKFLYWKSFKGLVIHMVSIAFLFLPRFIILVVAFTLASYISEEPTLFLSVGLLFTLIWFFYTNAIALNVKGVIKRSLFALAHLAIFIGLLLFTIIILLLSTFATVQVG
tara:strand:- start:136909 stop:137643 length:735 start_codon:yes stop_codon:yes gene_type:complete